MARKWTDEQLGKTISQDALADAERITGGSIHGDRDTQFLGLALHARAVDAKRVMLEDANDSCYGTTLEQYCAIIRDIGFGQLLTIPFQGAYHADEFHIWWEGRRGLLLMFDTYFGCKSVNGGTFYYCWRPRGERRYGECLSSGHYTQDGVWVGYHDCREAIRFNIRRLESLGEFVVPWVEQQWLWPLHYADLPRDSASRWKEADAIVDRCRAERLAMLPPEVRAACRMA